MKKFLVFLLAFTLLSCVDSFKEGPILYKSKIIEKYHKDAYQEFGRHYGYHMGEYKYHNGWYTVDAENLVKFEFFGKIEQRDNEELYKKSNDTLYVYFEKIYHVKEGDTTFIKNKILGINTQ